MRDYSFYANHKYHVDLNAIIPIPTTPNTKGRKLREYIILHVS